MRYLKFLTVIEAITDGIDDNITEDCTQELIYTIESNLTDAIERTVKRVEPFVQRNMFKNKGNVIL